MTNDSISPAHLTAAIRILLDETFDHVQGIYLDKGTSLFETLASVSASQASVPVGGRCATLAAQVKHTAFYLDVVDRSVRDPELPPVDWDEIWSTVSAVSEAEWQAILADLRASYDAILHLLDEMPAWPDERAIGGAIGVVAHTAYHLGEIRQALCTLQA